MPGGDTIPAIMYLGTIVVGIFSIIFLLYTNSFLIKRRHKEIGLYNILGMSKRHIAVVLLWETLYTLSLIHISFETEGNYMVSCRPAQESEFYSMYGGLLFLGSFLGALFLMATVLIIYYKQISEGYEDKARFAIMEKVGMSQQQIRSAIRSQVRAVFFLPLLGAVIHLLAAFKMITKLMSAPVSYTHLLSEQKIKR